MRTAPTKYSTRPAAAATPIGADASLASRARRRVQGAAPAPEPDVARQREVVDGLIVAIDCLADPERLADLDLGAILSRER